MSANYLAIPGKVRTEEAPVVLRIRQSVLMMNLMIKDLPEYTRTQLGTGIPIVPAPCDLGQVLRGRRDHVMIQVTNFGSPIAANAMQVIFNPLVQVPVVGKSAADRMSTSLGLGLFIVREIVVGHGGTLGVSSSVAGGTIFSIDLPRAFAGDGGIAAGAKNSYEGPVS